MYTVWNVTFRIKTDDRGPCDPLFRTEPLASGSVGDADPFSDAFGKSLNNVEDSLHWRSTRSEQASSDTSDAPYLFSLRSPMQDTPLTPNTEPSTPSTLETRGSTSTQLYHHSTSRNLAYYTKNVGYSTCPQTDLYEIGVTSDLTGNLRPIAGAPSAVAVKPEPTTELKQTPAPLAKKKRKKQTCFSVKTREQRLLDNKAAASRCRQQRKAWETHLQDMSRMLQASINASKSNINELSNELATLKQQLRKCPNCTDRYEYSRGPGSYHQKGTRLKP